ncbi:MAG: antibiotic biosynthesis monooxygenase [Proteobacteria bacterium]|nr:MAG: antibiotic biosynthesis monooxygenase [Pseudomonadota bacterium]
MYAVTVLFDIRPEYESNFEARVVRQAAESLDLEPGCRVFDVCRDEDQRNRFFLYEIYDDDDAFRAHLESNHFQAFDDDIRAWVLKKKVWTYRRLRPLG